MRHVRGVVSSSITLDLSPCFITFHTRSDHRDFQYKVSLLRHYQMTISHIRSPQWSILTTGYQATGSTWYNSVTEPLLAFIYSDFWFFKRKKYFKGNVGKNNHPMFLSIAWCLQWPSACHPNHHREDVLDRFYMGCLCALVDDCSRLEKIG